MRIDVSGEADDEEGPPITSQKMKFSICAVCFVH